MPTIDELKQQEKEHLGRLIELGYLPDPEQLPDDVRLLFVAHAEKKPWPYKDEDIIEAWRETQEIVTKVKQFAHMEMASKQSGTSGQNEQPSQPVAQAAKRKRGNREPNEHDRIRTTLAMWAIKTNMCRSKAHAATSLGIDSDTITNHEKHGWLYSADELSKWGGHKELWEKYTNEWRKM